MLLYGNSVSAETIFESGTLGPTGVTLADLSSQTVPGTNISTFAYNGVRFQLNQPVVTTEIGGHFLGRTSGSFFGAIITLDDENDFPNSGDLSTPDVLGSTLLNFPITSAEVFGDVALSLDPGWYALVFGSGLFGGTANGGAVRNGMDIGSPSYIAYQPLSPFGWVSITSFPNHRFVVHGTIVPEPNAICLIAIGLCSGFIIRRA
jgi:hypothetical protein